MIKARPPRRPLTASSLGALDVLAVMAGPQVRLNDFQLLMSERGYNAQLAQRAIARLERAGWLWREAGMLRVTEAGRQAIVDGTGLPPSPRPPRRPRGRMPAGLF